MAKQQRRRLTLDAWGVYSWIEFPYLVPTISNSNNFCIGDVNPNMFIKKINNSKPFLIRNKYLLFRGNKLKINSISEISKKTLRSNIELTDYWIELNNNQKLKLWKYSSVYSLELLATKIIICLDKRNFLIVDSIANRIEYFFGEIEKDLQSQTLAISLDYDQRLQVEEITDQELIAEVEQLTI